MRPSMVSDTRVVDLRRVVLAIAVDATDALLHPSGSTANRVEQDAAGELRTDPSRPAAVQTRHARSVLLAESAFGSNLGPWSPPRSQPPLESLINLAGNQIHRAK